MMGALFINPKKVPAKIFLPKKSARKFLTHKEPPEIANFKPKMPSHLPITYITEYPPGM